MSSTVLSDRTRSPLSLEEYAAARGFDFDELAKQLELEPTDVAYVTGSILDGMGDSQSDLDVYVLTSESGFSRRESTFADERRQQQKRKDFGIIYLPVGNAEIDVECHRIRKFEDLFKALANLESAELEQLNKTFGSLGSFDRLEALELLHRFRIAKPFANEESFHALRSKFDEQKFFIWNASHCLIQVSDAQKETRRSLNNGDFESAYLKLTRLYDVLVDAYLFSIGQSMDRWKWRLPKLRAAGRPSLLKQYLDVQLIRVDEPRPLSQIVTDHLTESQVIADEIRNRVRAL